MSFHHASESASLTNNPSRCSPSTASSSLFQSLPSLTAPLLLRAFPSLSCFCTFCGCFVFLPEHVVPDHETTKSQMQRDYMQMSLMHTRLSPGEVAVSDFKVGAWVPQTATGRGWVSSKARRCCPSYLRTDCAGTIGTLRLWAEATEKRNIGCRGAGWSWAPVCPERREPAGHWDLFFSPYNYVCCKTGEVLE